MYKTALVKQTKDNNPELNNVEIACRTGVDRRQITQHLNSQEGIIKPPKIKLIVDEIKRHCIKNNSNLIKQRGPFQSFEGICKQLAHGALTPASVAKELIRQGNIVDKGDNFEIISWSYMPNNNNEEDHFRVLTTEIDRFTNTVIYNYELSNNNHTQFQRNIFSTQISPKKFFEVKLQVSTILEKSLTDIDNIILNYEEDVPNGTYSPFGASMFIFGYENRKE